MRPTFTAEAIAMKAHHGQLDKAERPYILHPRAVAERLTVYGDENLVIAGLLHDVIEDSDYTAEDLAFQGIPQEAIDLVLAVTRGEGESYLEEFIPRVIAAGPKAVRLKMADIWHNTHPDRRTTLTESLAQRYAAASQMLTDALDASWGTDG